MNRTVRVVTDKRDEKTKQKGALFVFCPLIISAVLLAALTAFAGNVFSWGVMNQSGIFPETTLERPLKVTNERPMTVFFSFAVKGDVSKVRFVISRSDKNKGVTLLEDTVKVKDNVATSRLLLDIHRGTPLGRHDLYIQAFDAVKNVKILTGEIPYILLPSGSECMCQSIPADNKSENTTQGGIEHA